MGSEFAQGTGHSAQAEAIQLVDTMKSVDAKNYKVVVDHKEIPVFMAAMTMPYNVWAGRRFGRSFLLGQNRGGRGRD